MAPASIKGASRLSPQECRDRVQNWALFYVQRYAASRKTVATYLNRKIKQGLPDQPEELLAQLQASAVPEILDKMESWGYLNDAAYARTLYRRLLREGRSQGFARQKLAEKGVAADIMAEVMETVAQEAPVDLKLAGAVRLMQRRRFGCFGGRHADAPQKVFGAFARAGYDYTVAKQALAMDLEEAEDLLAPLSAL